MKIRIRTVAVGDRIRPEPSPSIFCVALVETSFADEYAALEAAGGTEAEVYNTMSKFGPSGCICPADGPSGGIWQADDHLAQPDAI